MFKLHFLGANRQVTGSRYCIEANGDKVFVDCGMFQEREFLSRNWETELQWRAQLRASTRVELKELQKKLKITALYVTHDQTEAMTLGDRVALLKDGRTVQVGRPEELYQHPATPFAARFIGSAPMNLVPAVWSEKGGKVQISLGEILLEVVPDLARRVRELPGREILLGIRPEDLTVIEPGEKRSLPGTIMSVETLGRESLIHVKTGPGDFLILGPDKGHEPEENVGLRIAPGKIHVFAREP